MITSQRPPGPGTSMHATEPQRIFGARDDVQRRAVLGPRESDTQVGVPRDTLAHPSQALARPLDRCHSPVPEHLCPTLLKPRPP
eukprot:1489051-Rhodomonas_salina.1